MVNCIIIANNCNGKSNSTLIDNEICNQIVDENNHHCDNDNCKRRTAAQPTTKIMEMIIRMMTRMITILMIIKL